MDFYTCKNPKYTMFFLRQGLTVLSLGQILHSLCRQNALWNHCRSYLKIEHVSSGSRFILLLSKKENQEQTPSPEFSLKFSVCLSYQHFFSNPRLITETLHVQTSGRLGICVGYCIEMWHILLSEAFLWEIYCILYIKQDAK